MHTCIRSGYRWRGCVRGILLARSSALVDQTYMIIAIYIQYRPQTQTQTSIDQQYQPNQLTLQFPCPTYRSASCGLNPSQACNVGSVNNNAAMSLFTCVVTVITTTAWIVQGVFPGETCSAMTVSLPYKSDTEMELSMTAL